MSNYRKGDKVRIIQDTRECGKIGTLLEKSHMGLYGQYWKIQGCAHEYVEDLQFVKAGRQKQQKQKPNMELRIVGYKAPKDLYDGKIKKGTVYIAAPPSRGLSPIYYPGKELGYGLPKEIVESWEPVHEHDLKKGDWVLGWHYPNIETFNEVPWQVGEVTITNGSYHVRPEGYDGYSTHLASVRKASPEEVANAKIVKMKVGSNNLEIAIGVGYINANRERFNVEQLLELYTGLNLAAKSRKVGQYGTHIEPSIRFIRIGCTGENHLFSLEEIGKIIDSYQKINNK